MKIKYFSNSLLCLAICILIACESKQSADEPTQSIDGELEILLKQASNGLGKSYYILPDADNIAATPQDPRNPLNAAKIELGMLLFHETGMGIKPRKNISLEFYSCASCHHVQAGFQAGTPQGLAEGGLGFGHNGQGRSLNQEYTLETDLDVQDIRSPSSMNIAYQKNVLWNGQFGATGMNVGTEGFWVEGTPIVTNHLGFEGVETQAIAAMDVHRLQVEGSVVKTHPTYISLFDQAFPEIPQENRINTITVGLAIAAYERATLASKAPFQKWLRGEQNALNEKEKRGAILFFGKAQCAQCHNGPALNSMAFYALGMKDLYQRGDVFNADFNSNGNKGRGGFTNREEDMFKFKVPQLYNLKDSPFYGHGSSFTSIYDVLRYKNLAIKENSNVPNSKLDPTFRPLNLSEAELDDLRAFIENGLYDPDLQRYSPSSIPSGNCFPNNDPASRLDLGCN